MLAKIREKTQGIIATFILVLVAIPFVLWGIGSYFEGGPTAPVAEVNGMEISQQAYRQRLEQVQGANPQRADNPIFKQFVVDSLIDQTLLVSEADDIGYRLSNTQLARMIREIPYFQQDGRFEPGLYEALLRQQGMRPADFEATLRRENVTTQIQRGLSDSAFVTDADFAAMVRLLQQERRISYALIKADAFLSSISVTAEEIETYYQANQESFRTPEAVRVEYLALRASDIGRDIQPTEEELRQAYEAEIARYTTPEKRKASHILISLPADAKDDTEQVARAQAQDLLKQIRAGADFTALAKKHSGDTESASKGGDLGETARGTLPAELEAAVFAMKAGEVSEPIRTSYGYHLAKVTDIKPERRQPYAAVKQELTEQVRKRKGEERFYELTERFRNLVYENPEGLEATAEQLGLKVQTTDWFTRSGGAGIAAQPRFVAAAFEPEVLSRARNSDAIEADAETLAALHVIEHRPSVVRPVAEVRATIERTLKEQRAREQARAVAEASVKKLEQGQTLKELDREPGVAVNAAKSITREQAAGVDPRIVEAVFTAPRPKDQPVVGQVDLGPSGYAVYALEAVSDGDPTKVDAAVKEKVRRQLLQRYGADYYASYRAGLRKEADIKINANQL